MTAIVLYLQASVLYLYLVSLRAPQITGDDPLREHYACCCLSRPSIEYLHSHLWHWDIRLHLELDILLLLYKVNVQMVACHLYTASSKLLVISC